MSYTITEVEEREYAEWVSRIPKKYKNIKYVEWFMFSGSSGIGITTKVRRDYENGDVLNQDITDYSNW